METFIEPYTVVPMDSENLANLPEPPLGKLYELFTRYQDDMRSAAVARAAGDPDQQMRLATLHSAVTPQKFYRILEKITASGGRTTFINKIVLGFEFCKEHPNDERIRMPGYAMIDRRGGEGWRALLEERRDATRDAATNRPKS